MAKPIEATEQSHLRFEMWIYGDPSSSHPASRTPHPAPRTPHPAPRTPHPVDEEDLRRQLAADRTVLTGRAERPVAVYITPKPHALPVYDAAVLRAAAAVEELPPTLALAGNYLGSLGVSRLVDRGAAAAAHLLRVHRVTS